MAIFARDPLNNFLQDYVVSGCFWTGDALGSTRAASMTAGTVCIGGNFYAVAAVTARTFTASKDTYIDVDSTGTVVYTEVANNAASPALTAGSIRIGIIVTGVSTIAAAGSVNQGQETMVLPIASSIPYAVTDSLGNLICPRDPQRKLLGYRQITSSFSIASVTATQITGLTMPIIVPTGRKVKLTVAGRDMFSSTATSGGVILSIWDGVVNSGTQVMAAKADSASQAIPNMVSIVVTPAATSKTYNAGILTSANTANFEVAATSPGFIMAELV